MDVSLSWININRSAADDAVSINYVEKLPVVAKKKSPWKEAFDDGETQHEFLMSSFSLRLRACFAEIAQTKIKLVDFMFEWEQHFIFIFNPFEKVFFRQADYAFLQLKNFAEVF